MYLSAYLKGSAARKGTPDVPTVCAERFVSNFSLRPLDLLIDIVAAAASSSFAKVLVC
jgi:hypothetical protein